MRRSSVDRDQPYRATVSQSRRQYRVVRKANSNGPDEASALDYLSAPETQYISPPGIRKIRASSAGNSPRSHDVTGGQGGMTDPLSVSADHERQARAANPTDLGINSTLGVPKSDLSREVDLAHAEKHKYPRDGNRFNKKDNFSLRGPAVRRGQYYLQQPPRFNS